MKKLDWNLVAIVTFVVLAIVSSSIKNDYSESQPEPTPKSVTTASVQEATIEAVETEEPTEVIPTGPVSLGTFKVTAYCACERCCPGTSDGITYTETVATEGRTISVDPKVIPLGSVIELNGKQYVAEDIGGSVKGNHVDLYFESHDDAEEWGVQNHELFLIEFTQFQK